MWLLKAGLALKQMSSEIDNHCLQMRFSLIWQSGYVSFNIMSDFKLFFMLWLQFTECMLAVYKVFKYLCPHANEKGLAFVVSLFWCHM